MDTVEQRIAQLEQRLAQVEGALERARRQKRAAWAVGACAVTAAIIAATATARTAGATTTLGAQALTVKAPFRVVDASGALVMQADAAGIRYYRGRVPLAGFREGPAGGQVYAADRQGDPRALMFLRLQDGQPAFVLTNRAGASAVTLRSFANGTGELAVEGLDGRMTRLGTDNGEMALRFSKGDTVQARVGADKNGGILHLNAEHGPSADLGSTQSGQTTLQFLQGNKLLGGVGASGTGGLLQLNNATGKKMLLLGENSNSGTVGVYDTAGQTKILLATTPAGLAELNLLYSDGNPAVQLAEASGGGYFSLTNRSGVARVEAGTLSTDQGIVRAFGPGGFNYIRGRKASGA